MNGAPVLQLDAVTAERNSLHEDLISHRDSKRTVDRQWRLERERCERLESELAFYQSHSAQALSDRDKVTTLGESALRICCLRRLGTGESCSHGKFRRLCRATASATVLEAKALAQMLKGLMSMVCISSSLPHVCQGATIMCGTVQAVWEAEELKGQLLKAEGDLRDARAALSAETDSRAEAERQLSQVKQQNDSLRVSTHTMCRAQPVCHAINDMPARCGRLMQVLQASDRAMHAKQCTAVQAKAKASEEIPALRQHLSAARTTTEQLEQHRDSLQVRMCCLPPGALAPGTINLRLLGFHISERLCLHH